MRSQLARIMGASVQSQNYQAELIGVGGARLRTLGETRGNLPVGGLDRAERLTAVQHHRVAVDKTDAGFTAGEADKQVVWSDVAGDDPVAVQEGQRTADLLGHLGARRRVEADGQPAQPQKVIAPQQVLEREQDSLLAAAWHGEGDLESAAHVVHRDAHWPLRSRDDRERPSGDAVQMRALFLIQRLTPRDHRGESADRGVGRLAVVELYDDGSGGERCWEARRPTDPPLAAGATERDKLSELLEAHHRNGRLRLSSCTLPPFDGHRAHPSGRGQTAMRVRSSS